MSYLFFINFWYSGGEKFNAMKEKLSKIAILLMVLLSLASVLWSIMIVPYDPLFLAILVIGTVGVAVFVVWLELAEGVLTAYALMFLMVVLIQLLGANARLMPGQGEYIYDVENEIFTVPTDMFLPLNWKKQYVFYDLKIKKLLVSVNYGGTECVNRYEVDYTDPEYILLVKEMIVEDPFVGISGIKEGLSRRVIEWIDFQGCLNCTCNIDFGDPAGYLSRIK